MNNRLNQKYEKRLNFFKNLTIFSFFFLLVNFFLIQTFFASSYKKEIQDKTIVFKAKKGNRGSIFDRNNNLLAHSINKFRFWIDNSINKGSNQKQIISLLSEYLDNSKDYYQGLFNKKTKYLVLEEDLISYNYKDLISKSKKIDELRIDYYENRIYPYNELAAQVIGFTNYDNEGKYGIEEYFNDILSGSESLVEFNKNSRGRAVSSKKSFYPKDGSHIFLTIDINIQEILQNELKNTLINTHAKSANGIIINPFTGEVIAMASIPDFDLNNYKKLPKDSFNEYYLNRVISAPYEPGSTFKIVCFAEALDIDSNIINKKYNCEKGNYNRYFDSFEDHDGGYDSLSFDNIFVYSSNIGTIKIFEDFPDDLFYNKMKQFGFGIKSNISLADEHGGEIKSLQYYKKTSRDLASSSIGQSILVTNLQLALAYSSIANGGYLVKPKIIKQIVNNNSIQKFNKPIVLRKNLKTSTSDMFISMLNQVVDEGTGKKAYVDGISIGGKTGTAEIWDAENNKYSDKNYVSSFASLFPINQPKYVMIISIESPLYDKHWGGETAAPCTKNIIKDIMIYDKELRTRISANEKA